jgi:hypothetical protein
MIGESKEKSSLTKWFNIFAKALLLFDLSLSPLKRTDHKDLPPPNTSQRPNNRQQMPCQYGRYPNCLSVTPKCHGSEHHACDELELLLLKGPTLEGTSVRTG